MKLLFDCTELSYINDKSGKRAGIFFVALNLLKEFQKLGVHITFTCDYRRYYFMKNILKNHFHNIKLLPENSVINKFFGFLTFIIQKFPIRMQYALKILLRYYDRYLYRTNKKNLEQLNDYDVYFSPFTPPSREIELSNLKKYRILHDTIPVIESGMPKSPKDWYYKVYNTINDKDFYIANSENTKNDVLKYFPNIKEENIKTVHLGVNENFQPNHNPAIIQKYNIPQNHIFSLCTLGKRKNLEFTIKNFFRFIEKHKINDLYLVLSGGIWNKFRKTLRKTLKEVDISKIILTGYVEDDDLPALYSQAQMFVFPSLYEGFGLPVLEAMACGCPVITSNTSSLPEVIGDCGIQINPQNNEDMVKALEKMYFDLNFKQTCSQKGLERTKMFSWEKCAKEILEFISL